MAKGITFTRPDGRKTVLKLRKLGLQGSSNLLTSTHENNGFNSENVDFQQDNSSVPDRPMPAYTRSIKKSVSGYPYRPAKLVPHDDVNKPWWIVFYVWDLTKEILVRKRVGKSELAMYPTKTERKEAAKKYIEDINYHLYNDHVVETDPAPLIPTINFHGYSVLQAIEHAAKYKRDVEGIKDGTFKEYEKIARSMARFLEWKDLPPNYKLRNMNPEFVHAYFTWMKAEQHLSNKTHNQHRGMLHAVVECLKAQNQKLFANGNPFSKVAVLKTKSRKHAAYTRDQMDLITKEIERQGDLQFLLFIKFIYYLLARPRKELRLLKVKNIFLQHNRVLIPAENAKTKEEYVGISAHLADLIRISGIMKYNPNDYVFTMAGHPGPVPTGQNYFYKRMASVLDLTGLHQVNPNFTLYGFKHSGAIQLYLATKDIKLLQRQCRHTTIAQTDQYLRDLGLFENFENLDKLKW